ncbi:hypothetical protein [Sphingomonas sp. dw_22]|uniref:hypothetical protein n=1 Tax=Sphingomonas sp. dw_22 TaxID=2721175 RepID=UPI001BD58665|nr:hypothetical protein [Sphingomonas sp. dw_22]
MTLVTPAAASFTALAVARSQSSTDTINLFDLIPQAFHAGIIARTVENAPLRARALTGHIQRAIDTAASKRQRLVVPAGLYNITPIGSFEAEAGRCQRCFAIRNGMHIDAEPGATFRIINDVSTNEAVVFMCMFGTNEQLADISWRGLEMDMNGLNNPISPARSSRQYRLLNQAHIFISGTPGGHAALATNVAIDRCRFVNTPGVSCIVTAQSNASNTTLGRNWRIYGCQFIDGGLDTPDHSAIYAWAQDVVCEKCTFANRAPKTDIGGNVAFEVHGSNQRFIGNKISNYYQGVWIDGNRTENISTNITISDNELNRVSGFGIMFYGEQSHVSNVIIDNNVITFDDTTYPGVDIKIGIGCLSPLSQTNVIVKGNKVNSFAKKTASSGFTLQATAKPNQIHDNFQIENNSFNETTFGSQIITNPNGELGSIELKHNLCRNLSRAGAFSTPQGIGVDFNGAGSLIHRLVLLDNICTDTRGQAAECAFGIRIQGKVGDLQLAGNSASGMTAAAYAEGVLTVSRRLSAAT